MISRHRAANFISWTVSVAVALSLIGTPLGPRATASAMDMSGGCSEGTQHSGAVYRICMPSFPIPWNGHLVVYAHGYVAPSKPVGIPEDQLRLPDGTLLPNIINLLGYAFATTSYSTNGLAVRQGMEDLLELVSIFAEEQVSPNRVYLVGVSEGGLIATLSLERYPGVYDGGMALCGPYGDFRRQIEYLADSRVVFDYFFPELLPPSPIQIPPWLIEQWDAYYAESIAPVVTMESSRDLLEQLFAVAGAAYDPALAETYEATIHQALSYNVQATNDAVIKLGGQPVDNQGTIYRGSHDDADLNENVQRFGADEAAVQEIAEHYQTSGRLEVPLVTMHTSLDPVVPYEQAIIYRGKTIYADSWALHQHFRVERYGHCNFNQAEVLVAFARMVAMVLSPPQPKAATRCFLPRMQSVRAPALHGHEMGSAAEANWK